MHIFGYAGVFDAKPDLSSFQTGSYPIGSPSSSRAINTVNSGPTIPSSLNGIGSSEGGGGTVNASVGQGDSASLPQPKLGLAPLSSELAFSGVRGAGR